MSNPWGICQLVNLLKILLGQLERFGGDIGDVFTDQFPRVYAGAVDLLHKEATEGLDTASQEGRVEGDIDALERDDGEAAFELEWLGFGGGEGGAFADDVYKASFDVGEGEGFHQRLDVYFLGFEQIGDVC